MQPQNNSDPNAQYSDTPQPTQQPIYDNFGMPVENTGQVEQNPYAQQFAKELAADMPQVPIAPPPKPTKKPGAKKLIVTGVVALLFAGMIGGGVAAFTQYQKPERVAEDALAHLLAAKYLQVGLDTKITFDESAREGMEVEINSLKLAHRAEGATNQIDATLGLRYSEKDFDLQASAIVAKSGDIYFRVDDALSQIEAWVDADFGAVLSDKTKSEIKKLENKWVKYGVETFKKDSPDLAEAYVCRLDTMAKLSDNESYRNEIIAAYRLHPALKTVGSAQYDGMMVGYQVEVDENTAKKFGESLGNTEFSKELSKCAEKTASLKPTDDESEPLEPIQQGQADQPRDSGAAEDVAIDSSAFNRDTELVPGSVVSGTLDGLVAEDTIDKFDVKATVWLDAISHKLKKIDSSMSYKGVGSSVSTIHFGYDQQMPVDIPSDSVDLADWYKKIEPVVDAVEQDIEKTRTKQSKSETEAAKSASMTAEQVRERAEIFRDKFGRFADTAAELESAELGQLTVSPKIIGTLPSKPGSVAYKKCAVGAQVAYKDSSRNKYVGIGLGGVSSGDVTALC